MRVLLAAALLLAAPLAGCVDDPGEALDLGSAGEDDREDAPGDGSRNRSQEDDTSGNRTGEGEAGDGDRDGNATDRESNGTKEEARERDPGWPPLDQADVRPGSPVAGGTCTTAFVLSSPDNATLYLATAAHCFDGDEVGERVSVASGAAVGRLVYHSFRTMDRVNESSDLARAFNDLALVEVLPSFRDAVHPSTRHYGGPTALAPGASVGDKVLTYGDSAARDGADELDPREGYVTGSTEWHVDFYLTNPGVPGDSGSPLLRADGSALGVLVTLEVLPAPGSNNAVKLDRALTYMEEHGGPAVELKTWGLADDGTLPR